MLNIAIIFNEKHHQISYRKLAIQAAENGVSLNKYIVSKFLNIYTHQKKINFYITASKIYILEFFFCASKQ
nr:toxin-antitoxin system HicB family antitoxin [Bartonella taylorii]